MSGRKHVDDLTSLEGCQVGRVTFERLTVVGPSAKRSDVIGVLDEGGFLIRQAGAYTDSEMFPAVDVTRFKIVADREIDG